MTSELLMIQFIRQGNRSGMEMLYDAYGDIVYGVIHKILRLDDEAENAMQETFIKVWRRIDTYNADKGRFLSWVCGIARNTAIDVTRSKDFKKQKQLNPFDIKTTYNIVGEDKFNVEHVGIRDLVRKLEPKYAEVIDLLYFEGYTMVEAAEQLELPLGTVKTRKRKAVQDLKKIFI